jgi:hypothetical protein
MGRDVKYSIICTTRNTMNDSLVHRDLHPVSRHASIDQGVLFDIDCSVCELWNHLRLRSHATFQLQAGDGFCRRATVLNDFNC